MVHLPSTVNDINRNTNYYHKIEVGECNQPINQFFKPSTNPINHTSSQLLIDFVLGYDWQCSQNANDKAENIDYFSEISGIINLKLVWVD
jgi:hypothetical protein